MLLAVGDRDGDRMTAAIVATSVNASTSHVAKIVSRLVELGAIESRGVWGPGRTAECAGPQPCPRAGNCRLRRAFADAREAFFATLDPFTVTGIVRSPTQQVLLTLQPAFSPTTSNDG